MQAVHPSVRNIDTQNEVQQSGQQNVGLFGDTKGMRLTLAINVCTDGVSWKRVNAPCHNEGIKCPQESPQCIIRS